MSTRDPRVADYGCRLFLRLGDRALDVARDMIAHLIAIGDRDRADDWHRILAAVEEARSEPATADAAKELLNSNTIDPWLRALTELDEIEKRRRGH